MQRVRASLFARLLAALTTMLVLTLIGVAGILFIFQSEGESLREQEHTAANEVALTNMARAAVLASAPHPRAYMLDGERGARGAFAAAEDRVTALLTDASRLDDPGERRLAGAALGSWERAQRAAMVIFREPAGRVDLDLLSPFSLALGEVQADLDRLADVVLIELRGDQETLGGIQRQSLIYAVIVIAATVLLALLLGFYLRRTVRTPLAALRVPGRSQVAISAPGSRSKATTRWASSAGRSTRWRRASPRVRTSCASRRFATRSPGSPTGACLRSGSSRRCFAPGGINDRSP